MLKSFPQKYSAAFWLLIAAVTTGAAIAVLQLIFSVDIYRDAANVYAFMARSLAAGDRADAFHPAIPSFNVLLAQPLIRMGLRPEQALSALSSLFYLATIPCLYVLLRRFVPETPAAFGALLFACAPKIIRFSCTGLIDSGKIFFLVTGLYCADRMIEVKFRSYKYALWFGVALGGVSLARSEGIGNAFIVFGCVGICWLYRSFREKRVMPLLPSVVTVAVWVLAILSRMWVNWHFCGKFIFDSRMNWLLRSLLSRPAVKASASAAASAAPEGGPSAIMMWWEFLNGFIRGTGEVYFGFALAGLLLLALASRGGKLRILWPDKKIPEFFGWRGFYFILLAMAVGNAFIFKMSGVVAYRYFLPNIPLLMVFIVIAAYWLWSWIAKLFPRPLRMVGGAAVAGVLVFQAVNGAENIFTRFSRRQHRSGIAAGEAMRSVNPDGKVWFLLTSSIEWYHSGMRRAVPVETPQPDLRRFADFDFVLIAKEDEEETRIIASRKDVEEIPLFPDSTVRLFRKIKVK